VFAIRWDSNPLHQTIFNQHHYVPGPMQKGLWMFLESRYRSKILNLESPKHHGKTDSKLRAGRETAMAERHELVGRATAIIGSSASLGGGITWFVNYHRQQIERQAKMDLAQTQAQHGEYQASVQTYAKVLKANSLYRPALDQGLNTTLQWVEDFHGVLG
jgi:hypothetical protein